MEDLKKQINWKTSQEAIEHLQNFIKDQNKGWSQTNYRLRDWLISRQRYWWAPIPVVYCEKCGIVPLDESQLPVLLPEKVENWKPRWGKSPLAFVEGWADTYCPKCGSNAVRETDTMDTFVDSSWYFLRYTFQDYKKYLKDYNIVIVSSSDNKDSINNFDSIKDYVNEINFFEILEWENKEDISKSFDDFLNNVDKKTIVLVNYWNLDKINNSENTLVQKEIVLLDEESVSQSLKPEDIKNISQKIFVSNFSFPFLEKNSINYGYKFFKLSWKNGNFSDNKTELVDFLNFSVLEVVNTKPWDKDVVNTWLPVDNYVWGIEHATMHLLYARFFVKALKKMGYLDFDEPFANLFTQWMINYEGKKMSKSKWNVVNPVTIILQYWIDTMRCYIFFMWPPEIDKEWSDSGVVGMYRWLQKIYTIWEKNIKNSDEVEKEFYIQLHKTIKKVKEDALFKWQPNTALATMMEFTNYMKKQEFVPKNIFLDFLKLLAPFAPFISEYFWNNLSEKESCIFQIWWPDYNQDLIQEQKIKLWVQFNWKFRWTIELNIDASESQALDIVKKDDKLLKYFTQDPKKIVYLPWKIINIIL